MVKNEKTSQKLNYGPKTLQILDNTKEHQRRFDPQKAEELLVDLTKNNSLISRLQEFFPENCRRNPANDDEDPAEALRCLKLQKKYLRERIRKNAAAESKTVREKKELAYRKIVRWLNGHGDLQLNPGYYHRTAAPVPENTNEPDQKDPDKKNAKEESKGSLRPLYLKDVNSSREVMYAFCGIMGFDYQKTTDFFWKVAFQPPFKLKVWTEQVYYYFAKLHSPQDGDWYAAAQNFIAKLEQQMDTTPGDAPPIKETFQLTSDASALKSEEDLRNYLLKNRSSFRLDNFNISARRTIRKLYDHCLSYARGIDPDVSSTQDFFKISLLIEDIQSYNMYDMVWKDIVNNYFSVYSTPDQLKTAQDVIRRLEETVMQKEPWKESIESRKRKNCDNEEPDNREIVGIRKTPVSLADKQKLNLSGAANLASIEDLETYLLEHRDHFYYSLLSVKSMDSFYRCLSDWSDAIAANFPTPELLDQIMQGEQELRDTVLRKMLILLNFYSFYAQLRHQKCACSVQGLNPGGYHYHHYMDTLQDYSKHFNEFVADLNDKLMRCGFGGLYPRNPYDCLFMIAASSAHPLEALPAILINGPTSSDSKNQVS